jgi:7,8-dihydropterin-6-yl-methyl-4-(beta-D-ribofuranosyl)aminobenzene 5'-phosphate synthase
MKLGFLAASLSALLLAWNGGWSAQPAGAPTGASRTRITILYDAFGKDSAMQKDWGYSAFIEYGEKRILFDTGNDPRILAENAKAKGIDLRKLDFVVMSHRHGDHMGGLSYVLSVNPKVPIYAPKEGLGVYGSNLPSTFYRKDTTLRKTSAITTVRRRKGRTRASQNVRCTWHECLCHGVKAEVERANGGGGSF